MVGVPYREADDPALATFPLRSSRLFPFAWALTVPMAAFGLWLLAFALPRLGGSLADLRNVLPELIIAIVLVALPFIFWKSGEPYLAAGASPALRLFKDRIEVAAPRAAAPLRLPLDKLGAQITTTVVRHVTGIPLSRATFLHLRAPGLLRSLSTRLFESPEAANQALAQILCLQATGRIAPPASPEGRAPVPDDEYEQRLQAELERLRRE